MLNCDDEVTVVGAGASAVAHFRGFPPAALDAAPLLGGDSRCDRGACLWWVGGVGLSVLFTMFMIVFIFYGVLGEIPKGGIFGNDTKISLKCWT